MTMKLIPISAEAVQRLGGQNVRLLSIDAQLPPCADTRDFSAQWAHIRQTWSGAGKDQVRAHPVARAYVSLYATLGINANKVPPSAVNLVTRFAIAGGATKAIPRIHPAVDAGNVVQAETLMPVAVFDASAITGELLLDVARDGDSFLGFGFAQPEPVAADRLVLRDSSKVISEFCYRDGQATAVHSGTRFLKVVIPVAPDVSDEQVSRAFARLLELLGCADQID